MIVIKGFVENDKYLSNNYRTIAPFGEFSVNSKTYSKNLYMYKNTINSDLTFTSCSVFDDANGNVETTINSLVLKQIDIISEFIYHEATTKQTTRDEVVLFKTIMDNFGHIIRFVKIGNIINNVYIFIPEFLEWETIINNKTYLIRIWFTNNSFSEQYDDFEITVIPPIERLDDFFLPEALLKKKVEVENDTSQMEKVQLARELFPETMLKAEMYDFHSKNTQEVMFSTTWHVLIYGIAGNDIDKIKEAICSYILNNSTHTRDEWVKILPELFKHNEFVIIPRWDLYAIPDRVVTAGVHSALLSTYESGFLVTEWLQNATHVKYPALHLSRNLQTFTHPYKNLGILVIGNPENKQNIFKLSDFIPDYISVSSTSIDFNRMSNDTMNISKVISELIILSETTRRYTSLPNKVSRVIRDGKMYLVKKVNGFNMLVACKNNFVTFTDER